MLENLYPKILYFVIYAVLFIYSIIFHEIAHGFAAYLFGDDTAKKMGRITINPLPHIDMLGSIILPAAGFLFKIISGSSIIIGWAKPVPVNPDLFINRRWGEITVSLAGVTANFIMLFFMIVVYTFTKMNVFIDLAATNFILIYLNILPIPPLDGYNFVVNILPVSISEKITNIVRGREKAFLGILFLLFTTPIGQFIFKPAGYLFTNLAYFILTILGFRG